MNILNNLTRILVNKITLIRKITIVLLILTILPFIGFGVAKANEYREVQQLLSESKKLSSVGRYHEAVVKLTEAQEKWSLDGTKKEISTALEENKTLIQSTKDYELGKELFDKEKYKDSLGVLKKVESENINYPSALSLIELAEKKLTDTRKGEVAGVKTETKKITQITYQATPTPTLIPSTPTPTSEPKVDVTALCNAKKQQMAGSIAESAYKASAQAEANAKNDPMFYQIWMGMQPNIQTMMKNWTVKTLGEYEVYCLNHNGDDSGWSPSSGPFDSIKW